MEETAATHRRAIRRTKIAVWIIFAICIALLITIYIFNMPPPAHKYDALARCIAQTSTTFYGAFWCPHCHDQKNMFGTGAQYLPYHECSAPDGTHELQSCIDQGVQHYPTWVFPDGSRLVGVVPLSTLSQKTGCPLPTSTPS